MLTLAMLTLTACGESAPATQTEPFEIDGPWLYLGPSDVPHDLTIGQGSMVFTDVAGSWSSTWTITAYDNGMQHFQLQFGSGSGAYLPMGDSMSGAYDVSGTLLTLQLVNGLASYPPLQGPGTCTSPTDGMPVAGCKLYVKKN
jgi:hypothetical protein